MTKLLFAISATVFLVGCLDTSITTSIDAPDALTNPDNTNDGPIADGLLNGPSGSDLSSVWRCGTDDSYFEYGFGRDGTGSHLVVNQGQANPLTGMLWAVEPVTDRVLLHPDEFGLPYWLENIVFEGNSRFISQLVLDTQTFSITCDRRGDVPPPDVPIEDILSNGGSAVSAETLWRCDTNTGIRLAFQLYDNGTGIYVDDTDPTNIGIDRWRAEAGDIVFDFEDSLIGGFRDYAVQDMDSFTSTEFLRGDSSFGAASCNRADE